MITYKQIDRQYFERYDTINMIVHVRSIFRINKVERGLVGLLLAEEPVNEYVKNLAKYEIAMEYEKRFDISNWIFFMSFDEEKPVGAITLASRTENVDMLEGRDDLAVLWDIRVAEGYKHMGIGQQLFDFGLDWCKKQGLRQLKIECQNNNVPACKFYHKQGAVLCKIDEYAYYRDEAVRNEVQLVWYLDL